jgi:hypothetical protein
MMLFDYRKNITIVGTYPGFALLSLLVVGLNMNTSMKY